jgi:predicted nuclease of predicted toxin-antitoxin system
VSVRFLADADLNYAVIHGLRLREPFIDFKTANDAGLEGLSDPEVLELAAREERVLVSHDKSTMPVHFAARVGSEKPGSAAGVAVCFCGRDHRVALDHLVCIS